MLDRDLHEVSALKLVVPSLERLDAYADALRRGWSPDNIRLEEAPREELARIAADPVGFVASLDDREARGGPIPLPGGGSVPYRRWMWDDGSGGGFCGSINFRWQPGTEALPDYCPGHIGYGVPAWRRGRGYATRGLALLLPEVRKEGLRWVELTADLDNVASHRVIERNGGVAVKQVSKPGLHGDTVAALQFRIDLA